MSRFLKNYSLSIILFLLFIGSLGGQAYFQYREYSSESRMHGNVAQDEDFLDTFLSATLENWQSEFLQLFSFVVLATYFIHKGSPQSRDSEDEVLRHVRQIARDVGIIKGKKRPRTR